MGSSCCVGVCLGRLESYIIEKKNTRELLSAVSRRSLTERQVKRMGSTTAVTVRLGNSDDVWVIMRSCFFSVCVSGDGGVHQWGRVSFTSTASVWRRFFFFFFRPGRMLNLVFLPAPAVSSTCAMKRHTQAHAALQLSHLSNNMGKHHGPEW